MRAQILRYFRPGRKETEFKCFVSPWSTVLPLQQPLLFVLACCIRHVVAVRDDPATAAQAAQARRLGSECSATFCWGGYQRVGGELGNQVSQNCAHDACRPACTNEAAREEGGEGGRGSCVSIHKYLVQDT